MLVMESQNVVDIPSEWLASGDAVAVESQAGDSSSPMTSSDAVDADSSPAGSDSQAESESGAEMLSDDGMDKADRGLNVLFGSSAELGTKSDSDVVLYKDNILKAGDSSVASDAGSASDSGVVVADSGAYDKTMQSDDFEELVGASSGADSATLSDSGYVPGSGSGSDSGSGPSADFDKTMQSDDFEMMGSGSGVGVSSSADSQILSDSGSGANANTRSPAECELFLQLLAERRCSSAAFKKIPEQCMTVLTEYRFRMELNTLQRRSGSCQLPMAYPHDFTVFCSCGDFKRRRE